MKRSSFLFPHVLSAAALSALLGAQGIPSLGQPSEPRSIDARAATALSDATAAWRVPIHTQPDDPVFGRYGWWAAQRDYKVSFHEGFAFYPFLGPDYPEHLPLRWTTLRVTAGGEPIADPSAAEQAHTDWRFEYRYGGVTEVYDVRADGVEQTFVVARRPERAGDLVVEGRLQTLLVPVGPLGAERHGALVFADARGTPIVRYGEAFAFDAQGSRTPVSTRLEGEVVQLTVPAAWLACATFPVTVDPLTSRVVMNQDMRTAATTPSIHCQDESTSHNAMIAVARQFTAGDQDVYVHMGRSDLSFIQIVWADVSSVVSSLYPDVTFVGGADRWVVGFWRHTASEDRVRAYFHDKDVLTFNSGVLATNHNPGTEHASFPAAGGLSHPTRGTTGVMVYRSDPFFGNSTTSVVWAVGLDAAFRSFTTRRERVSRFGLDAENPDVTCQLGWNDNGWVAVYQGRTDAADDHDIYATRISTGIGWMGEAQVGPDDLGDKARPVVQGWDGRYLVAMLQDVTPETHGQYFGRNVHVDRFDWSNHNGLPTRLGTRVVMTRTSQEITRLGLGFDDVTRSHWSLVAEAAGPRCVVHRLGFRGAVTESQDLSFGHAAYAPTVAWDRARGQFPIVYCSADGTAAFYGQILQYPAAAQNVVYGSGCGPGTIASDTAPYAGSEFYRVRLTGAPASQAGVLMLSTGSATLELGAVGAPNCFFHLTSIVVALPFSTDGTGAFTLTVPLREPPPRQSDVYWQFAYGWPGRPHALPYGFTAGLRSHIE